jgi:phthiocerol/phenolphthiocerol synthesis type-I polyketide synthase C
VRPFRRNISYFGIDADQLLIHEPALTANIFKELSVLFGKGVLSPLPYRSFDYDEIGLAFRLMQNAGHIGKIIVTPPVSGKDNITKRPAKQAYALSEGVCLVVGGIGGFGLAAANWLVEKGAKHIALSTRSGKADEETLAAIKLWEKTGITASVHACDVTDAKALAELLAALRRKGPLVAVLHAAMVLDDALISNLNRKRNRPVIDTKAKGAELLDRLTRQDPLELFLMFSSATTMVGNPGQANYVAANGYLEGLARQRRAAGLAGLAVGFGAIADKGFLARNAEVGDLLAKRIGKNALTAAEALRLVEQYLTATSPSDEDQAVVMISELDLAAASALAITKLPLFSAIAKQGGLHSGASDGDQIDLVALIAGKDATEALALLHSVLAAEIGSILRVGQETVTPDKVLKDIGLDSLMAMELGMSLQQKTGLDIPLSGLNDGTTVADVTRKIHEKLGRADQNNAEDNADATENLIGKLVVQHGGGEENVSEKMVDQDGYGR